MTAALLIYVFRRLTPGVFLSVLGFAGWSLTILEVIPAFGGNASVDLAMTRCIVLAKVVAAVGLILLALEDPTGHQPGHPASASAAHAAR